MKGYLILNHNYKKSKEINESSFIGLIENVANSFEALQRARRKWDLQNEDLILEECMVKMQ